MEHLIPLTLISVLKYMHIKSKYSLIKAQLPRTKSGVCVSYSSLIPLSHIIL